jgi:hypothetical protein
MRSNLMKSIVRRLRGVVTSAQKRPPGTNGTATDPVVATNQPMIRTLCTGCGQSLKDLASARGEKGRCENCLTEPAVPAGVTVVIPAPQETLPADVPVKFTIPAKFGGFSLQTFVSRKIVEDGLKFVLGAAVALFGVYLGGRMNDRNFRRWS